MLNFKLSRKAKPAMGSARTTDSIPKEVTSYSIG